MPADKPSIGKLFLFAIQQIIVMFPATVLVALLTGFHVSTTIFASGLATLGFVFFTKGKIPLYYGSSFSYIAAIVGITGAKFGVPASDLLISQAQFGIIMSGLVSIAAGLAVNRMGKDMIERILPATVTGAIAMVIGISLAGVAMTNAVLVNGAPSGLAVTVALITLLSTIIFSVYLRGVWAQLPILLGILVGYICAILLGMVDFTPIFTGAIIQAPHFTFPTIYWPAVLAIMPIAIATIPESSAHLFQLDLYVNNLARKMGRKEEDIASKLGTNLIGDGIGDIISASIGGPAGTNYGENLSTMAITNNFSVWVLGAAAVMAMILAFVNPLSALVLTVPSAVINGACIYLFGIIAAQGVAIMIEKKVSMFDSKSLAVVAVILVIGLGGTYGFAGGMIPVFGMQLPAIAAAALFGIVLNLVLSFKKD
jgi:uracil permease